MPWTFLASRRQTTRLQTRPRHGLRPVEHLEERLAPSTAYYHLANGPFSQNWASHPFTTDNNWNGVPSIVGYSGAGLAAAGQDPQTVTADGSGTAVTVKVNQSDPTSLASGGIADFNGIAQPTVGLRGDSTASAPFLQLYLDTTAVRNVVVSYTLRDLQSTYSDNPLPFALQYRIGTSGAFTNLPAGYVADASVDTSGLTNLTVTLPGDAYDQPQVQVRILTTNPGPGSNNWVGVDAIRVTGTGTPAQALNFTIDSANSTLTASGSVAGSNIQQQGTGSLTTHYSGNIATTWDRGAGTLSFNGAGTNLVAANSGTWSPAVGGGSGSAAADYGAQATVFVFFTAKVAVRDLTASIATASGLALAGAGPSYTFPSTQTLTVTNGNADYNIPSIASGRSSIAGNSAVNTAAAGTFQDLGNGSYRLTIPINVTINTTASGQSVTLRIVGTIVANATLGLVDLNGPAPGTNNEVAYNQADPPVALAPAATVTRSSGNLTSMTITLTNRPDGSAEALAANAAGTGLTVSAYNPATGQITVTGSAAPSAYQSVLRTLTYSNTASGRATDGNRLVEVTVSDGTNTSLLRTTVVAVTALNQAPTLATPPDQTTTGTTPVTFSTATSTAITYGDVDAFGGVEYLYLQVSNGTLAASGNGNASITTGVDGSGNFYMIILGTVADINLALDGLVYTANAGFSGVDTLILFADDLGHTGAGGNQTAFNLINITVN